MLWLWLFGISTVLAIINTFIFRDSWAKSNYLGILITLSGLIIWTIFRIRKENIPYVISLFPDMIDLGLFTFAIAIILLIYSQTKNIGTEFNPIPSFIRLLVMVTCIHIIIGAFI